MHRSQGHRVVVGKDGGWGLGQGKELLHGLESAGLARLADDHQGRVEGDSCLLQRLAIAIGPQVTELARWLMLEHPDAAVSQRQEMLCRDKTPVKLIDGYAVDIVQTVLQNYGWDVSLQEWSDCLCGGLAGDQDDAIYLFGAQHLGQLQFACQVTAGAAP